MNGNGSGTALAYRRSSNRKRLRAPCIVRYLSSDGRYVHSTGGRMRDISCGGLGVLIERPFNPGTPVRVSISVANGKMIGFPGKVAFSKEVRHGWYLIGVRLGEVDDPRLADKSKAGT